MGNPRLRLRPPGSSPYPPLASASFDAGVPGQDITLRGHGFAPNSQAELNGIAAASVAQNSETLIFRIPQGATSGDLKVVLPPQHGQPRLESNSIFFTVGPKPQTLTFDYGLPGTAVGIRGTFGHPGSSRSVSSAAPCARSSRRRSPGRGVPD